jgi:hypothetical protein
VVPADAAPIVGSFHGVDEEAPAMAGADRMAFEGRSGPARRDQHGLLAALIRSIFHAEGLAQARDRLSEAVAYLDGRLAKVATMIEYAEAEILAFHWCPADGAFARTYARSFTPRPGLGCWTSV